MPDPRLRLSSLESLAVAAECLRTLAHSHRLRIIQMLMQGEFTVGELAEKCEIPSAMASEHLRLMQRCGLLDSEKESRKVFYRIKDLHVKDILKCIEKRYGADFHAGT